MPSIIIIAFVSFTIAIGQSVLYTAEATINEYKERQAEMICEIDPTKCGQ